MKLRCYFILLLALLLVACASTTEESVLLASFTENYVAVSIRLERNQAGDYYLAGTFSPPDGYHLYSKDIPVQGVEGLGRPTLLELTANSLMKPTGELMESVTSQEPDFEPKELLVYPLGAVTLRLPVDLPSNPGAVNDELKITYMACSATQCKPPVEGKVVSVQIPRVEP